MPKICKLSDLLTNDSSCIDIGGIKSTRIIKVRDIDFQKLNDNLSEYFDKSTGQFVKILPVKNGKSWATLSSDYDNIRRNITANNDKPYFDLTIQSMRFMGYISTTKLTQMRNATELVVATLTHNGIIIIDGLEYNDYTNTIQKTRFITPYFSEVAEDSNVFGDEIGLHTILNIKGRQKDKGYMCAFNWDDMNSQLNFGIYVADNLFAFITDNNSLFNFN